MEEQNNTQPEPVLPEVQAQPEATPAKKRQLTTPMAIVLGAFIIAIAILVVKMPARTASTDPNSLDENTIKAMVKHVLDSKNQVPVAPVSAEDHVTGSSKPKVTIIEYSDLECPFCKNFHGTMEKVMDKYDNKVAWVYRHFPLDCLDDPSTSCTPLHPKARPEAIASECAFEQGGNEVFWKYINQIFAITPSNNKLDPEELTNTAQDLKLNMDQFKSCIASDKYAKTITADVKKGFQSNVKGTPNTIIVDSKGNTYSIAGAYPYEVVTGVLDQIL